LPTAVVNHAGAPEASTPALLIAHMSKLSAATRTASRCALMWLVPALTASPVPAQSRAATLPPAELLGEFRDDYGNAFRITDSLFAHLPGIRYHVVEWNVAEQYLIARNDSLNPADAGLWTRIDWMSFTDMAPWTWGFCLTAYKATSAAAARATPPASRETPRTGCNGFPFSRMRRAG
jgi:hypothetical protein